MSTGKYEESTIVDVVSNKNLLIPGVRHLVILNSILLSINEEFRFPIGYVWYDGGHFIDGVTESTSSRCRLL